MFAPAMPNFDDMMVAKNNNQQQLLASDDKINMSAWKWYVSKLGYSAILGFVVLCCAILYTAILAKRRYLDWPRRPLMLLEGGTQKKYKRRGHRDALKSLKPTRCCITAPSAVRMYRPFNLNNPGDFYGTIEITQTRSATLTISAAGDDFEVVIYSYPDWSTVYSNTNLHEVPFDFLPPGLYTAIVFSTSASVVIEGALDVCTTSRRKKPPEKAHRKCAPYVTDLRDQAAAAAVEASAPSGTTETSRVVSYPAFLWPSPVHTKIEELFASIPAHTAATASFFIAVPAYGVIVSGFEDHFVEKIHEGNHTSIYSAVAKEPTMPSVNSDVEDENSDDEEFVIISVIVAYPGMDGSATRAETISPTTTLFVYN
jgi:hypothetical protein